MNARRLVSAVLVGGFAMSAVSGCAMGKKAQSPTEVVSERQRYMKLHGALWKDIQDKSKAGNIEGIAPSAEALALNSKRIPAMFPEGTLTDKSKAKPEIWQKWPEFEQAAMKMGSESEKLRDAAMKKDAAATQAIIKDFGRNACGSCHTPFRVPPPARG